MTVRDRTRLIDLLVPASSRPRAIVSIKVLVALLMGEKRQRPNFYALLDRTESFNEHFAIKRPDSLSSVQLAA